MSMMAELITIMWRDIPAQVTARAGRRKVAVQLDDRFQVAIDRAAVKAGKETTDEYLAQWHRIVRECGPDLTEEADAAAAEIEDRFTPEVLGGYVRNGGLDPEKGHEQA